MRAIRIPLDLSLPEDALVDLFLLQCWSPPPVEAGGLGKLPADASARRGELLRELAGWLQGEYCPANPGRPFFVLAPELSVSLGQIDTLDAIAENSDRPTFVIAGLEFQSWDQYTRLLHEMNDMPEKDSWLAGGNAAHIVNTAVIVVRDRAGVRTFLQPKRNPSDVEGISHYPCQNVLLFQSRDQSQGVRLNFCVQICADLTNYQRVRDLRRACEDEAAGRPLDFTFVLQRNENQEAPQFKRSIEAYFETLPKMADTSPGCLVFINNANKTPGKTTKWGSSMMLFPFGRWRTHGSPTYWLKNEHDYQAVVVREPGPTLYWFRYKPHYLVSRTPGSGQSVPFVDNHALGRGIIDDRLTVAEPFAPFPPVTHWLLSEWEHGKAAFVAQLTEGSVPSDILTDCERAYQASLDRWKNALAPDDMPARHLVTLYFSSFSEKVLSDQTQEPQLWDDDVCKGTTQFLEVYSVLSQALAHSLQPHPRRTSHAQIADHSDVVLIWGGNQKLAQALVATAREALERNPYSERPSKIVILVGSRDNPEPDQLRSLARSSADDVTKPSDTSEDEVTRAKTGSVERTHFICDQRLWALLSASSSRGGLTSSVIALLEIEG